MASVCEGFTAAERRKLDRVIRRIETACDRANWEYPDLVRITDDGRVAVEWEVDDRPDWREFPSVSAAVDAILTG